MGKASKWFRGLLGLKKSDPNPAQKPPVKKKWSFVNIHKEKDYRRSQHTTAAPSGFNDDDASRHAIAVATATAAAAEAAVAAAQAATAVVKLTGTGGSTSAAASGGFSNSAARVSQNGAGYGTREERAAVTIQSHFRAYLARRALRALKALVKLQALAKGYICRKQFTEYLHQMHAIARAQARARAGRVLNSEASNSSTKSSNFNNHNSPTTPEKFEHIAKSTKHQRLMTLKRNGSKKSNGNVIYDPENSHSIRSRRMSHRTGDRLWEQGPFTRIVPLTDDEKSDKILEVDTGKPHLIAPKYRRNIFHSSHLSDQYCQTFSTPNPSSGEVPLEESNYFCTADNSPQHYSASSMGGSSKRAPLTPTKSDGSKSYVSGGYFDHPNYMAYTESSKAKARSVSVPKQRPQYERSSSSANRYSVHGFGNNDHSRLNNAQKVWALHASFTSKDYPGSGRLDRLGMPIRDVSGFSRGHWHRY